MQVFTSRSEDAVAVHGGAETDDSDGNTDGGAHAYAPRFPRGHAANATAASPTAPTATEIASRPSRAVRPYAKTPYVSPPLDRSTRIGLERSICLTSRSHHGGVTCPTRLAPA